MADIKIGVIGCAGRMGRMLIADIVASEGCALAGGTVRHGSPAIGQDLGETAGLPRIGIAVEDKLEQLLRKSDVAIDFTAPAATAEHAALAARLGRPLVIGTTGLDGAHETAVRDAAQRVAIVWAANTSLGINLLLGLVRQVAERLGPDWDIEIVEAHHKMKVDAPSGTALALGHAAAEGRGITLNDAAVRGRDGITGAREAGKIGFAAMRGGDVVGEHSVIFFGAGERLELTHRATNRGIYAKGALRAAQWLIGRPPGLYGMHDVLGL